MHPVIRRPATQYLHSQTGADGGGRRASSGWGVRGGRGGGLRAGSAAFTGGGGQVTVRGG